MTNTILLEEAIRRRGVKKGFLAERLGVSRTTFRALISNGAEFKASQIRVLCEILQIDDPAEMEAIFFAPGGA